MTNPTMPERLEELAARCEAAEGAHRLLDANIHVHLKPEDFDSDGDPLPADYCYGRGGWTLNRADRGFLDNVGVPRYTASIDAAMRLVPEGLFPLLDWNGPHCRLRTHQAGQLLDVTGAHSLAATPALALCAASLRAIAQEQDNA